MEKGTDYPCKFNFNEHWVTKIKFESLNHFRNDDGNINEMPYGSNLVFELTKKLVSSYRYKAQQIKGGKPGVKYDKEIIERKELIRYVINKGGDPYLGGNKYKTACKAGGTIDKDLIQI